VISLADSSRMSTDENASGQQSSECPSSRALMVLLLRVFARFLDRRARIRKALYLRTGADTYAQPRVLPEKDSL
jgi:hypothetical protein